VPEVSGCMLNFFKSKAIELGVKGVNDANYDELAWYSDTILFDFFNKFKAHKNALLLTQIGDDFFEYAINKKIAYLEENVKNGVMNIHKLYTQVTRGDSIGIWKTRNIQDGYIDIEENSIFDEFFTKGFLQGILKKYNCIGSIVKQVKSVKDDEKIYFNQYELTWMKKIK
jgi:hypothetical protein